MSFLKKLKSIFYTGTPDAPIVSIPAHDSTVRSEYPMDMVYTPPVVNVPSELKFDFNKHYDLSPPQPIQPTTHFEPAKQVVHEPIIYESIVEPIKVIDKRVYQAEAAITSYQEDKSETIVISCYFNPMKSPYRLKAFNKFYEGIKHFDHKIVECIIGDGKPELPANIEKIYTKDLLWHKEGLLNNIIRKLPANYKYIFWVDADVIFTNPNWVTEGVEAMKAGANIVQPFEWCVHLIRESEDHDYQPDFDLDIHRKNAFNPEKRHKRLWRSFCSNKINGAIDDIVYDIHGHVGFAWGIKRSVIEKAPGLLYDKALIGGADHVMAHAAVGHIPHPCITKTFAEEIVNITKWSEGFYAAVQGKIGYVNGDLYHIWHGDTKNRNHVGRIKGFAPTSKKIHHMDTNGLYVYDNGYIDDDNFIYDYFIAREVLDLIDPALDPTQDFYNYPDPNDPTLMAGGDFGGGGASGTWIDGQPDKNYQQDNNQNYDTIQPDNNSYQGNNYQNVDNSSDYRGSTFS